MNGSSASYQIVNNVLEVAEAHASRSMRVATIALLREKTRTASN